MNILKALKITTILLILIPALSACTFLNDDYTGEHPDLYSVAINSLLGARGSWREHVKQDPIVLIGDEDSFGRRLFLYYENAIYVSTYSLLICQSSDERYSYFYPHYNFISLSESHVTERLSELFTDGASSRAEYFERVLVSFPEDAVEELKVANDWDMPLDSERCIRVEIVRNKPNGPVRNQTLMAFYRRALGDDALDNRYFIIYHMTDDYGRSIYVGSGRFVSVGPHGGRRHIVMLFQPDGSYNVINGVMELSDLFNYQDELREFKERNNWNMPFEQQQR